MLVESDPPAASVAARFVGPAVPLSISTVRALLAGLSRVPGRMAVIVQKKLLLSAPPSSFVALRSVTPGAVLGISSIAHHTSEPRARLRENGAGAGIAAASPPGRTVSPIHLNGPHNDQLSP